MKAVAALAAALAALLFPAGAGAAAGSLDRSFAGDGRLTVQSAVQPPVERFEITSLSQVPMASAAGPNGELLAANDRRVLRFRADGRPRRHFGGNGRVAIPVAAGTSFELAGLAGDSRGRVLVAGTTAPSPRPPGAPVSAATVYRFLGDGRLDPSFGSGGVATVSASPFGGASVELTGLALDSAGRPVTTGFSAGEPATCAGGYPPDRQVFLNRTFVLRLDRAGAPDPSFGSGGFYTEPALEDPHLPALAPSGRVVFANRTESRCPRVAESLPPALTVLHPNGAFLRRFAASPAGDFEIVTATAVAVDRRNRIVVLISRVSGEGGGRSQQVRRFLPDGSADPSFGDNGEVKPYVTPGGWLRDLVVDGRNRVVLAGSTPRGQEASAFLAMRLNAAGRWQRWFGSEGWAVTGFGKRAKAAAATVHRDSSGRIVLGGTVEAPYLGTGFGLAFARYLSGGG